MDVSEGAGICQEEPTINCGSIAETTFVQVTPFRVQCCSLTFLQQGASSLLQANSHLNPLHIYLPLT